MNIVLDDNYRITSDPMNIVLKEKKIGKRGQSEGKEIWTTIGYYNTIKNCLKGYLKMQIRVSEAESIEELITTIERVEKKIENLKLGVIINE